MQYKAVAEIIIPGIDFRPKQRKQASGTEVGKGPRSKTSVPNSENRPLVRKSARGRGAKLPSQTAKTGLWYGSQQGVEEQNFRPKCRKPELFSYLSGIGAMLTTKSALCMKDGCRNNSSRSWRSRRLPADRRMLYSWRQGLVVTAASAGRSGQSGDFY